MSTEYTTNNAAVTIADMMASLHHPVYSSSDTNSAVAATEASCRWSKNVSPWRIILIICLSH